MSWKDDRAQEASSVVEPEEARGRQRQALWRRALGAAARLLVIVLAQALVLWFVAQLLPGVTIGPGSAVGVSVAMLIALMLVWPLFLRFFFKLVIWTAGLVTVVVNGFIVQVAGWLAPELAVDNFGWAVLYALIVTIVLTALLGLISFEDAGTLRRIAMRRHRKRVDPGVIGKPGIVFLEIDGLSHDALLRAMKAGKLPTLRRWMESGSHSLAPWETDLSSQTSASQAGLLHGDNSDIPAFRWFDKQAGRVIVSSDLKVLGAFEEAHSKGDGLLADGGTARASMFSGDAVEVMLVASRVREERGESYRAFFASPLNFTHTVMLLFWEVLLETGSKWWQRLRRVEPRVKRHFKYTVVRAGMTVALRDLSLNGVVGDMLRGIPYSYVTLAGYDEVAHHSGLDRHDTLTVLRKIDARIHNLTRLARIAPRDYQFVVLSDHGQTQGATFRQRYGGDLEGLVRSTVVPGTTVGGPSSLAKSGPGAGVAEGQSDWEHIATVDAAAQESGLAGGRTGRRLRKELHAGDTSPTYMTDVLVMASGNLGLISFTNSSHRLSLDEIERDQPELIERLAQHPGIGFVMVGLTADGAEAPVSADDRADLLDDAGAHVPDGTRAAAVPEAVVIGANGRRYVVEDRCVGEDPLAPYGTNAARHLRRTNSFANCPDILVMSTYWPDLDENAAFEELVGNHGGLGGEQCRPFLLYPSSWKLDETELVGAESVFRNLKRWTRMTT